MNSTKSLNTIDRKDKMRGTVIRIDDPMLEGRIAVMIPKILLKENPNSSEPKKDELNLSSDHIKNVSINGNLPSTISSVNYIWVRPQFLNEYMVPYIGQVVYCFFEDGDPNKAYYETNIATLNGTVTPMEKVKNTKNTFDKETKPKIKVIKEFSDGTIIYYDENDNSKRFAITYKNNMSISINYNEKEKNIELVTTGKNLVILDDLNKSIRAVTGGGHTLNMSDNDKSILVKTTGGHSMNMSDSGKSIRVASTGGNTITIADGGNTVTTKSAGGGMCVVNPTGCMLKSTGVGVINVTPAGVSVN